MRDWFVVFIPKLHGAGIGSELNGSAIDGHLLIGGEYLGLRYGLGFSVGFGRILGKCGGK